MKKLVFVFLIISLFFVNYYKVSAKYVITKDSPEIIKINSIENPDKVFDEISLSASEVNDYEGVFTIKATDKISGIKKLELYINGKLYHTFEYDEPENNKTEELEVDVKNIPFYENCYAKGIDFKGNEKTSNEVTPNTSRINDLTDLLKFRTLQNQKIVNFENRDLYLLNDIKLSGNWEPIGTTASPFKGQFHGKNHVISNLQITVDGDNKGFFGVNQGEISDLTVNGNINSGSGFYNIGGISGSSDNLIKNCKSNVEITGENDRVGGIVGVCAGYVGYCINYGNIAGHECVGGICGFSSETYIECCGNEASSTIKSSLQCSGGIAGYIENQLSDRDCSVIQSYNRGQIEGYKAIGGIVGSAWSKFDTPIVIKLCYNTGNVNSTTEMHGGILGGTQKDLRGEDTSPDKNVIMNCYNVGKITNLTISNFTFQLTHEYATVINSYYPIESKDVSGYGTKIQSFYFKLPISVPSSLVYILDSDCKRSLDNRLFWNNK